MEEERLALKGVPGNAPGGGRNLPGKGGRFFVLG